ncbi:chromosomal replication initiator protein DnaA [Melissococcus plutonius]|uniref:Chromosomal replication initiator protein DnaA n=1 Tax=Melissococcus plutonius (strain ATCC 35311 / DSM 29964 / CIP 104052 / LMG 20360 / NCIMB 702443) TaxID=940190 RepID=F3Y7M2_MELPT|nr:chromosomal replication initiator protein DnaA [Melissococcus plutonius]AIM24312.1 chromosomal replication initiator protein DnaA [Melissococcus plutonius S1]KMT24328.1 chromosomal replication initiator protein DnaA [Melissococcus plutonius]KMT25668.1 chromosomal replication initiator protein DnaA [Melissococcus plutonius]KMT27012.1 chromosomal replication initiator protein DnaA [Melissococcus plutonius]KMT30438.1 chromosomal replication initiator protein DnaA [Melissococcus plutonius]
MPDVETFWKNLEVAYQSILSVPSFDAWIKTTHPLKLENNQLWLEVPSAVHKNYWEKNLAAKIVEMGFKLTGTEVIPFFVVAGEMQENLVEEKKGKKSLEEPFDTQTKKAMLNPKYSFDTFVIGKGNQMAHAAALVVAEDPGSIYNPLFFYGGVGLGKTHLMHAIGHQMCLNQPDAKVKYVSSETFTNEFINSIQTKNSEEFRKEYRNVDLLLVDDIQFLAEKEATLEEFFHTFNDLYNDNKQIVLTSDRPPNDIQKLPERLVSRFAWGLSVDITPPDLETRIAILRKKADAERLEIPDDTLSYIAGQIDSNIRELEGALVRVQAYGTINGEDITTSLAADALKSLKSAGNKKQLSILQIQEEVAKYYHIPLKDLKGKKRIKSIVVPRQISMYLSREMTENSLPKIGAEFGGKDHTTVIHAHEKIQQLMKKDPAIQKEVNELKNILNS